MKEVIPEKSKLNQRENNQKEQQMNQKQTRYAHPLA
jgi:hypothetical protein